MSGAELMSIRRLLEAQVDTHYGRGAVTAAIGVAAAAVAIPMGTIAGDANAEAFPDQDVRLWDLLGIITVVAGGAVNVDVSIAMADGVSFVRITPIINVTIDFDPGSAVAGTVVAHLNTPFRRFTGVGTTGILVALIGPANVGTLTIEPFLTFTAKTPLPIAV